LKLHESGAGLDPDWTLGHVFDDFLLFSGLSCDIDLV
jgi:hypothetical protein